MFVLQKVLQSSVAFKKSDTITAKRNLWSYYKSTYLMESFIYFDQSRFVGQHLRESGAVLGPLKPSKMSYKFYKQTLCHTSAAVG